MDLKERVRDSIGWIQLAQNRKKWWFNGPLGFTEGGEFLD
jgi:hypothetical protein